MENGGFTSEERRPPRKDPVLAPPDSAMPRHQRRVATTKPPNQENQTTKPLFLARFCLLHPSPQKQCVPRGSSLCSAGSPAEAISHPTRPKPCSLRASQSLHHRRAAPLRSRCLHRCRCTARRGQGARGSSA